MSRRTPSRHPGGWQIVQFALTLLVALVTLARPLGAQTYPAPASDYLTDLAGMFSRAEASAISNRAAAIRRGSGVHVALLTVPSLAAQGADTIEGYATAIFNAWGIGDARRNDGILILIARDDRKMRIELGRGYPRSADAVAAEILRQDMTPAFRDRRYGDGVLAAMDALERRVVPMLSGSGSGAGSGAASAGGKGGPAMDWTALVGTVAMLGLLAAGIAVAIWQVIGKWRIFDPVKRLLSTRRVQEPCPVCGKTDVMQREEILRQPTAREPGRKAITRRCRNCDHLWTVFGVVELGHDTRDYDPSPGGFDGGGSDGGGASGDW